MRINSSLKGGRDYRQNKRPIRGHSTLSVRSTECRIAAEAAASIKEVNRVLPMLPV